jgi:hypothetical protein
MDEHGALEHNLTSLLQLRPLVRSDGGMAETALLTVHGRAGCATSYVILSVQ